MIVLKAQLTIDPARRAAFLHHMNTLVQASMAENGCISFGCYEDVTAPGSFIVLAEWQNQDALKQHEESAHVTAFKAQAGQMIVSRQETRIYTVSRVGGLDS